VEALARIFHQDAELWRRTGRDRLGSTGAANRSFRAYPVVTLNDRG
jgi:hypothetical protein